MDKYFDIERKLEELQRWVIVGLCFMVTASLSGVIGAVVIVKQQNAHIEARAKETDQGLACYIDAQLSRSVKALPQNAYYKSNPEELRIALANIGEQRSQAEALWGICEDPIGE